MRVATGCWRRPGKSSTRQPPYPRSFFFTVKPSHTPPPSHSTFWDSSSLAFSTAPVIPKGAPSRLMNKDGEF
ncbi:hypothetical protein M0802_015221 [Mischocyttarus mexicanus]|nr:hypothetical protein M0802_015221 [Mischocyttarus mexicanus]